MPAALIHPAVPPPTMTTRNGCDRLSFRVAALIELPPRKVRRAEQVHDGAPSLSAHRISELEADAELVTPINPRPPRILENRSGSRGCRRVAKYLLLVHGLGIQQVGRIERQLQMGAYRVTYRTVE